MVQLASEKSSVAWFRLAECVGRKEKERALIMLRLLVHAITDKAYVAQLEGDLLWAFRDERAVDSYKRAIAIYEETHRVQDALQVYEQLIAILGPDVHLLVKMVEIYQTLGYEAKMLCSATQLMRLLVHEKKQEYAQQLIAQWHFTPLSIATVLEVFLVELFEQSIYLSPLQLDYYLQQVLQGFLQDVGGLKLNLFLTKLAVMYPPAYEQASQLLAKVSQP